METKDGSRHLKDFIWFFRLSLAFLLLTQKKYFVSKLSFTTMKSPEISVWCTPERWFWNLFFSEIHYCILPSQQCGPVWCKRGSERMASTWTPTLQLYSPSETEVSPILDFVSYLKLQPEYISQYYTHFELYINPFTLYDQLCMDLTIAFASDNNVKPSQGSNGFVIASADTDNQIVTYWG